MVKWVESRCYEEERHSQDVQHLSQKEERCRLVVDRRCQKVERHGLVLLRGLQVEVLGINVHDYSLEVEDPGLMAFLVLIQVVKK